MKQNGLNINFKHQAAQLTLCVLIVVMFSLWAQISRAQSGRFKVPQLSAPVVDNAQIISEDYEQKLNAVLKQVRQMEGRHQIQVLTVSTLEGISIEEASIDVATAWGLGDKQTDKGVLLFIAPNDRQVRIEVGQGLEGDLTDAYSKRIIDQFIIPSFKAGQFDQGVTQGVIGILSYTNPDLDVSSLLSGLNQKYQSEFQGDESELPIGLKIILFIIFIIFLASNKRSFGGRRGYYGGGGFGGGGFGGGGGWSGGGGGFSGGGASGRW